MSAFIFKVRRKYSLCYLFAMQMNVNIVQEKQGKAIDRGIGQRLS